MCVSKPVSRILSRTAIYLGPSLPVGSSHLLRAAGPALSYRVFRENRTKRHCSPAVLLRIEFTAAGCSQPPGELLPRLSTLTTKELRIERGERRVNGGIFLWRYMKAVKVIFSMFRFCVKNLSYQLSTLLSQLSSYEAVFLCCTGPEVAFGGRYPLSLPFGVRTFLVSGLSAIPRGCPACSLDTY